MGQYIWLLNHHEDRGLWGAGLASVLLHVAMFAVMATTSIFFPQTGDTAQLDIVWLYSSLLLSGDTAPVAAPPVPAPAEVKYSPPVEKILPQKAVAAAKPAPVKEVVTAKPSEPVRQPPPATPVVQEAKPEPVTTVPEAAAPETEPEMALPPPTPPQVAKAEAKPPESDEADEEEEQPAHNDIPAVVSQEKTVVKETVPPPPKADVKSAPKEMPAPVPTPSKVEPAPKIIKTAEAPVRKEAPRESVAVKAAPKTQPPVKNDPPQVMAKPAPPPLQPTPKLAMTEGAPGPALAQNTVKPGPAVTVATPKKPEEQASGKTGGTKGIFLPPIRGDLKLDITARPEDCNRIKIIVQFRAYPKNRHTRPMSKGEAGLVQIIQPTIARQSEKSLAAVIETGQDGVYEFRNVTETADAGEATYRLKIYENSPRARVKPVGSRKVSAKGSIVKVLMPEGITWDDDDAFSGSMEDSDSVTKFNSTTGLVWKEYR